jgi:homoserine O-acetyltransferase
MQRLVVLSLFLLAWLAHAQAADYPRPAEGDFVVRDFRFNSGETLPELRIHYRTLGEPALDERGVARNAVLILHGTTGSGANFIRKEFAGELFGAGQPLDTARYFLILPVGNETSATAP